MNHRYFNFLVAGVAAAILFASSAASAKSRQNDPQLPYQWTFDHKIDAKINKTLDRGGLAVGLSRFEQKMLGKYGIGIGQPFFAQVRSERRKIIRTATGLRFVKLLKTPGVGNLQQFPLQTQYRVSRVSVGLNWDFAYGTLAWVFDNVIQMKIRSNALVDGVSYEIGLSLHHQKLLQRYGIQVGDSFRTSVAGDTFAVQRIGLGLKIQVLGKNRSIVQIPS